MLLNVVKTDNNHNKLCKGDGLQVQIQKLRITNYSGNPSSMAVLEIPDKEGAGAALNAANLKHVGFLELEFTNSVSWETTEAEAFLLLSHLSTPSRILFVDDSFGTIS